jgi:hypothetical protein
LKPQCRRQIPPPPQNKPRILIDGLRLTIVFTIEDF